MGLWNGNVWSDIVDGKIVDVQFGEMAYVHPTFFYESIWNLVGVLLVYLFAKFIGKKYDGQLILLTFGWYGLGRFFIEGLRTDSLYVGKTDIRVSQALAAVIFLVCVGLLIFYLIKKPKAPLYHKAPVANSKKKITEKAECGFVEKIKAFFTSDKPSDDNTEGKK